MNNGAFGENFPYSNFHDLNMDWIIKIAKDFLDQYTEIQNIIEQGKIDFQNLTTSGLEQLQEKYETLETLLDQWYTSHSNDIADQLASALTDLNNWYNTHSNDISNELETAISDFETEANRLAQTAAQSIPADYSALSQNVVDLWKSLKVDIYLIHKLPIGAFEKGSLANGANDTFRQNSRIRTPLLTNAYPLIIKCVDPAVGFFGVHFFDENRIFTTDTGWVKSYAIPANSRFRVCASLNPNTDVEKTVEEIYNGFIWNVENDFDNLRYSEFEMGSIEAGENDTYHYNRRARSIKAYDTDDEIVITADNDWAYNIIYYDSEGKYTSNTGWTVGTPTTIPAHTKFRLLLESYTDTADKSLTEILTHFQIKNVPTDVYEIVANNKWNRLLARGTFLASSLNIGNYFSESRIATPKMLTCSRDIIINIKSGWMGIVLINDEGTELEKDTSWIQNRNYYIPAKQKFGFTISQTPSTNTPVETDELLNGIEIKFANIYPTSINPNKIFECRNVDSDRYPPYSKWYIQAARKNQYDRVRVNVRRTTDGVWVCIHDNVINTEARNSDGTEIGATISSDNQSYATLNSYDWGIKYGPKYAGYGVPTLEDVCKYASAYNMGLTIETMETYSWETYQSRIDSLATLIGQYGLLENLIVISVAGSTWREYEYWKTKSKYISFHIGSTKANIMSTEWKQHMDALVTGYNSIYIGLQPFEELPDEELVNYCMRNGYRILNTTALNINDLINVVGLTHGITLIEAQNVYMIKDFLVEHGDSLVNQ